MHLGFQIGATTNQLIYNLCMIVGYRIMQWCPSFLITFADILSNCNEILHCFQVTIPAPHSHLW